MMEDTILIGPQWVTRCDGLYDTVFFPDGSSSSVRCPGDHCPKQSDPNPKLTDLLRRIVGEP